MVTHVCFCVRHGECGCECVGVCVESYCGWLDVKSWSVDECMNITCPFLLFLF